MGRGPSLTLGTAFGVQLASDDVSRPVLGVEGCQIEIGAALQQAGTEGGSRCRAAGMRQDVLTDLGKSRFELSLVVGLEIQSAAFLRGLLEQCLAGMESDRVGDKIVFGFAAIKLIDIGPKVNVIERSRHADQRVVTGRAVVAQRH